MSDLAVSGWALAAFFFGLWWGERGRRQDAQLREAGRPIIKPPPAKVHDPTPPVGGDDLAADIGELREKEIQRAIAETGCSRETAEADVDGMLSQLWAGG